MDLRLLVVFLTVLNLFQLFNYLIRFYGKVYRMGKIVGKERTPDYLYIDMKERQAGKAGQLSNKDLCYFDVLYKTHWKMRSKRIEVTIETYDKYELNDDIII